MVMTFIVDGNQEQIKGDPSLDNTHNLSHAMPKLQDVDFGLLSWNISTSNANFTTRNSNFLMLKLQQLLNEFTYIFIEPFNFPPKCTMDHHIPLKEGVTTISHYSYRYGHFQKDEIELQVVDILATGVIQPTNSPFSSHILLVCKKRWWMGLLCWLLRALYSYHTR